MNESSRMKRWLVPGAVVFGVVFLLLAMSTYVAWGVFVKRSDNGFIRGVSNVIPLPAGKVGNETVLYRDFLRSRDALKVFLVSDAAKEQQLNLSFDATLERNVLEKLLTQAALQEQANKRNIGVTDEELRAYFADVISVASSTTPDIGSYLLKNFGWSEEDFRQQILRPALLEQKIGQEMASEQQGNPAALASYLENRLKQPDVKRYLRI